MECFVLAVSRLMRLCVVGLLPSVEGLVAFRFGAAVELLVCGFLFRAQARVRHLLLLVSGKMSYLLAGVEPGMIRVRLAVMSGVVRFLLGMERFVRSVKGFVFDILLGVELIVRPVKGGVGGVRLFVLQGVLGILL